MKFTVFSCLFLLFTFSCQQKSVRTLTVTIDESINKEAQWVYWTSLYGNEFNIIDSCFIEQGQTQFVLKDTIMNDSVSITELTFSEVTIPWERSSLKVDSKDRDIRVYNLTSNGFYENGSTIVGAHAQDEIREIDIKTRKINIRLSELMDDLQIVDFDDSIAVAKIVNERDSLKKFVTQAYLINKLDSVKYTTTVEHLLDKIGNGIIRGSVSRATYDSILLIVADRYPNDIKIQELKRMYLSGKPYPPDSERSKYWHKRKDAIRNYTYFKKDNNKLSDGYTLPNQKGRNAPGVYAVEPDTTNVPVYMIGTEVKYLKIKDPMDRYISISDLKTDYILIDFWATWCAPCVAEIPNILKVHTKYKNRFSVYAISLDNTRQEWIEGIEKYNCRQLAHVYAGSWATEDARLLTNSFGITTIPANLLLDKNRRIIAKNLRGDQLDQELVKLLDKR